MKVNKAVVFELVFKGSSSISQKKKMEGNLEAAIESLLNVEKLMRLAGDVAGTKKAVTDIVLIRDHSLFFDKLVELIPAKFYLPTDDKEKVWFQGLSKAARASAKKETREKTKKARRVRLDPDKSSNTLELLKKSLADERESTDNPNKNEAKIETPVLYNRSVTYEELRQRYQQKVKELTEGRTPKPENVAKMEKREEFMKGKRKRANLEDKISKGETSVNPSVQTVKELPENLAFGRIKIGDEDERKKKRKLSKAKTLERAKKIEETKKDPKKGDIVAKKHSWSAATSRAMGIKVHDDPKLLKLSMKKEKKRQQKSAEKWKERAETVEKIKADKQQTRKDHISERSQQKKLRKIAKREKKLMRPGFEGRKEGYINES